jgi:3-oxoacyl-[acyl-carrier protein] reductase
MDSQLTDKVVLITGAAGGIGSAIARQFAAEGARVVLHYRANRTEALRLRIELGGSVLVVQADLTREAQVKRLFARVLREWGRIDSLVVNAADWEKRDVPLHEMTLQQWQDTQNGTLTSAFLCLREFLRVVAKQRAGNAVLIGSTAAVFGEAGHVDYAAAKAGLAFGLTRSLKNEIARLAPTSKDYCGGRVNCVCPGWTVVPRNASRLDDPAVLQRVTATMPLRKVGQPADIANAVVFLASDKLAGHITGQTLTVAGGMEGRLLWG